ncbi:MAG: hypothetical protein NXI16_16695 [Alphaproteobacteria bacterium]|nr:hypothetical protein [Alphaproteobacteria bacterium]
MLIEPLKASLRAIFRRPLVFGILFGCWISFAIPVSAQDKTLPAFDWVPFAIPADALEEITFDLSKPLGASDFSVILPFGRFREQVIKFRMAGVDLYVPDNWLHIGFGLGGRFPGELKVLYLWTRYPSFAPKTRGTYKEAFEILTGDQLKQITISLERRCVYRLSDCGRNDPMRFIPRLALEDGGDVEEDYFGDRMEIDGLTRVAIVKGSLHRKRAQVAEGISSQQKVVSVFEGSYRGRRQHVTCRSPKAGGSPFCDILAELNPRFYTKIGVRFEHIQDWRWIVDRVETALAGFLERPDDRPILDSLTFLD